MIVAQGALLGVAVAAAWLATLAFVRLRTPFERLHAVTFLNVVGGGGITGAAFFVDGFSVRAFKCLAVWTITLAAGALLSFRTARALHMRGGERQ